MMAVFQHVLWGYELSYPDDWSHQTQGSLEAFAAIPQALAPDYTGPGSGQILVRAEWNCAHQQIGPIWNRHIGMLASWLGAKQVGSAPWRMGGASGLEAEIVLPKKDNRRLWTGILERNLIVLHFIVLHMKEERAQFEPLATRVISSLRFPPEVAGVLTNEIGLPLPPDYLPVPPESVIEDIPDPQLWRAYHGSSGIDALQAFYLREALNYGWTVEEYVPFPSPTELGFSRLKLVKAGSLVTLGLMPYNETDKNTANPARLVFKTSQG